MFEEYPEGTRVYNNQQGSIRKTAHAYEKNGKFFLDIKSYPIGTMVVNRSLFEIGVEDARCLISQLEYFIRSSGR